MVDDDPLLLLGLEEQDALHPSFLLLHPLLIEGEDLTKISAIHRI